jgi:hypothetical protein
MLLLQQLLACRLSHAFASSSILQQLLLLLGQVMV